MASKRKLSPLWNHFEELPNKKAKCGYCSRLLAVSSSSIGSLSRHMKSMHPTIEINSSRQVATVAIIPNNEIEIDPTPSTSRYVPQDGTLIKQVPTAPTMAVMADFVQIKKILPRNCIAQLDEQLVKMIAKGYHALRMVDVVEFRKFVEMLNPGYTLPTRKTLSESLLPKVYNKVLECAKKQITKAAAVCITTDAWTSIANDGFIAVTAHFINVETHTLCTVMIGCIQFEERHTSANLKSFLEAKFMEWNIEHYINVVVSDNAANVLGAVRLGGWRSLPCFAHTINLAVQSSIKEIGETVHKVKAVVEYFHRSNPAKNKLSEIQQQMNMSPLKLKQDVATRWNSTYDMIARFLRIKEALIATLAIMRPDLCSSQEDWLIIEISSEVLKVFYEVTVEVSVEKYVSASKYIVFCKLINRSLNKHTDDNNVKFLKLLKSLKTEMQQRFGDVESNPLLAEATILDPRFKKSGFSKIQCFDRAASALKLRIGRDQIPAPIIAEPVPQPTQPTSSESGSIWEEFDAEIAHLIPENPTAAGIVEFDKYIEEPLIKRTEDPLLWWNERKGVYPRLYKYMLKRLNITATSVPCELVFSKAGLTLNERRTRLKTKKLSELMFISCN